MFAAIQQLSRGTLNKFATSIICLAVILFVTGCGETNIQSIDRLRPAYSVYRNELAHVIVDLPPVGSVKDWSVPSMLFPAPVFFEDQMNDPKATAEIYYFGERNQSVSLSIRSPIEACIAWTGPKNPLSPDVWDRRGALGEECEAAIKRPWLVLLRVAESQLPERLRMEAFLIYVPNWKVVGAFPLAVFGRYREGDLGRDEWAKRSQSGVTSAFHQAASCELSLNLNKLPGGVFQFDHRTCSGEFLSIAVPASLAKQVAGEHAKTDSMQPSL